MVSYLLICDFYQYRVASWFQIEISFDDNFWKNGTWQFKEASCQGTCRRWRTHFFIRGTQKMMQLVAKMVATCHQANSDLITRFLTQLLFNRTLSNSSLTLYQQSLFLKKNLNYSTPRYGQRSLFPITSACYTLNTQRTGRSSTARVWDFPSGMCGMSHR